MTAPADDPGKAAGALLRLEDLPGPGWLAGPAPEPAADADDASPAAAALVDGCAPGFPEEAVTAHADSERFSRADALAYSMAWELTAADPGRRAVAALAEPAFGQCFVAAVAAGMQPDPRPGSAVLLGQVVEALAVPPRAVAAAHRGRLTAGTGRATLTVHLDLMVIARGCVVALVLLADSPDPTPAATLEAVAGAIAGRLTDPRS